MIIVENKTIMKEHEKLSIGCVIMASGLGKRFGGNKLMAELGEKPLIQWIVDVTEGIFDERIVVTRSMEVKELCEKQCIHVIYHKEPDRNDTVRLGLTNLSSEVDYCFFMPADQPFISKSTFLNMLEQIKSVEEQLIWRASFEDTVGTPVCFPKWAFHELLVLPKGKGGSVVMKKYSDKVKAVQVEDKMELKDIDTKEDLCEAKEYLKLKKYDRFCLSFYNKFL